MDSEMGAALKTLFETKFHGAMRMYLETCSRCGLCVKACHVYASMPEAMKAMGNVAKTDAKSCGGRRG